MAQARSIRNYQYLDDWLQSSVPGNLPIMFPPPFGPLPRSGPVFTKGLRLSQVLGLNVVLKLRLLSRLSFVLKPYSQRVT